MPSCLTELIGATRGDSAEYSLGGIVEGVNQRADKKGGDTDGLKSFVKSIKLPGVFSTAQTVGTQLYEPGSTSAKMAFIIGTRAGHWQAQSLTPTHHRPTPHAQATVEHRRRQLEACTIQLLHCVTQALHTAITLSILSTWTLLVLRGRMISSGLTDSLSNLYQHTILSWHASAASCHWMLLTVVWHSPSQLRAGLISVSIDRGQGRRNSQRRALFRVLNRCILTLGIVDLKLRRHVCDSIAGHR